MFMKIGLAPEAHRTGSAVRSVGLLDGVFSRKCHPEARFSPKDLRSIFRAHIQLDGSSARIIVEEPGKGVEGLIISEGPSAKIRPQDDTL
jgi:hypothetical protein